MKSIAILLAATISSASSALPGSAQPPEQVQVASWIRSLSIQAATYCAPIVAMYNLRYSISFAPRAKSRPGEIWRFATIATPTVVRQTQYVTPNVNVLYGYGFIDLRREPVILSVPDSHGRYYMVEMVDMWTNDFAYAGGTATGYRGGKFALVAPGWHGDLPQGVTRINAPTRWIELQPRVFVKDQADLAAAKRVLDEITVTGVAEYEGRTAPATPSYNYAAPDLNPNIASSKMPFKDPTQFWTICSAAMRENPPPRAEIDAVLPQYKVLGLMLGKQWTPQAIPPFLLQQMKDVARQIAGMLVSVGEASGLKNGWLIPSYDVGNAGADFPTRAIVAVGGLTANTVTEAIYYDGITDKTGHPLTGAKKYTMTFAGDMSYIKTIPPGFWSLTIYDATSSYTIYNRINRYALGSDDNLKRNADGSFTIYIQHRSPGRERESNWLPAPAGPFYLTLRNYAPSPMVYERLKSPATFVAPPPLVAQP